MDKGLWLTATKNALKYAERELLGSPQSITLSITVNDKIVKVTHISKMANAIEKAIDEHDKSIIDAVLKGIELGFKEESKDET